MQHGFIDSLNKGVKFLKNRGTASAGEHNRVIYYSQLSWLRKLATAKSFWVLKLTLQALALRQILRSDEGLTLETSAFKLFIEILSIDKNKSSLWVLDFCVEI